MDLLPSFSLSGGQNDLAAAPKPYDRRIKPCYHCVANGNGGIMMLHDNHL